MTETIPYITRLMRLRFELRLNRGRLLVFSVLCLLGIAVEFTNTNTGVASQFHHFGSPQRVADGFGLAYVLGGLICLYVRHWWSDVLALLPLIAYLGLAFIYTFATGNLSAPVVYGSITALSAYVLWRR